MSGHSHARTVKHKKDLNAQKRSRIFSKINRLITVAIRDGGPNIETNTKLRIAVDTARSFNMPKDNIEKVIKKNSGGLTGEKLEEVFFEAYGPGGIAILIEGITDNKNRTLGEVKKTIKAFNGKMVGEGAIRWMFERKGCITIVLEEQTEANKDKDSLELIAIEAGAEDVEWSDESLYVYVGMEALETTKKALEEKDVKIESSNLEWKAKEDVEVDESQKASCLKLFDALDDSDDIQDTYSNLKD